jgi:hypothetical protein
MVRQANNLMGASTMLQANSSAASAFETDFWSDAELRKTWDEIVPGEPRKTLPHKLTQGVLDRSDADIAALRAANIV